MAPPLLAPRDAARRLNLFGRVARDRLANSLQTVVLLSAKLQTDLAAPGQDAAQFHEAALRASAALQQLQPDNDDDPRRV